ncbi:Mut7-C RNAse domain-containing protein [Nocardia cyriacigeorgica]|uniref:Mut7-C ubiquitin/RNAse domain-containing protein n=1 Tax=Nocardia cyriacigeorgica TaxID=135487 RepID=A0A6P1DAN9_9NOCA|nr:Mut7-C RNAse domain-containing protein [Nocardia cyriacigeorgica]NEW42442.1 Mut7-C ubiquitin/RNAse domain-containing protein [Nocardia cyriacigeorgica]NEW47795.1 Mut7-C ubiquitin/RNAse domain-containing protein [Nocardia cyriacigeorgica]
MTAGVELRVYAELNDFLPPSARYRALWRPARPHQTVKDVVEAAGVPHTEIDLLLVNGESVDFAHRPHPGDRLAVYPVFETLDIGSLTRVRPHPLRDPRFLVDVNLGGLARLMRLIGFDIRCEFEADDAELAEISAAEHRILLTRDRGLLARRIVTHGVFVRSDRPVEQIVEVVTRLDLAGRLAPLTRCVRCGGLLADVAKRDIADQLQPLTRRYYNTFRQCGGCGRIYWAGAHQRRLDDLIARIRSAVDDRAGTGTGEVASGG